MRTTILLSSLFILLAASSCTNGRQHKESQTEITSSAPFSVQGKLVIGHEVSSFIADGDTVEYWITDNTDRLDSLYRQATAESTSPYTPVYTELKVRNAGKSTDGFAAEYAGTYEVMEIIRVSPLGNSKNK